jgi:hypothetical protein
MSSPRWTGFAPQRPPCFGDPHFAARTDDVGLGERFRTPARAARATRGGPASESRPCPSPRAISAALWGFEESGAGAEVVRPSRPTADARQRWGWTGFEGVLAVTEAGSRTMMLERLAERLLERPPGAGLLDVAARHHFMAEVTEPALPRELDRRAGTGCWRINSSGVAGLALGQVDEWSPSPTAFDHCGL